MFKNIGPRLFSLNCTKIRRFHWRAFTWGWHKSTWKYSSLVFIFHNLISFLLFYSVFFFEHGHLLFVHYGKKNSPKAICDENRNESMHWDEKNLRGWSPQSFTIFKHKIGPVSTTRWFTDGWIQFRVCIFDFFESLSFYYVLVSISPTFYEQFFCVQMNYAQLFCADSLCL